MIDRGIWRRGLALCGIAWALLLWSCYVPQRCLPNASKSCYQGHIHWFDTCGKALERAETCQAGCDAKGCTTPAPRCGDGKCDTLQSEDCSTCAKDCPCPPKATCIQGACRTEYCGDGTCQSREDCSSCPKDCSCNSPHTCQKGTCAPPATSCGNARCDAGETCSTCPKDCACQGGESCTDGKCTTPPASCGDGKCGSDETCSTCPKDCTCKHSCASDGECTVKFEITLLSFQLVCTAKCNGNISPYLSVDFGGLALSTDAAENGGCGKELKVPWSYDATIPLPPSYLRGLAVRAYDKANASSPECDAWTNITIEPEVSKTYEFKSPRGSILRVKVEFK